MKLTELEPHFVRFVREPGRAGARGHGVSKIVTTIKQANGVRFLCPKCFARNGGASGTHLVVCWNGTVPDAVEPGPGRWEMSGKGLDNLTLKGIGGKSDSVMLTHGCAWHGFIRNGEVTAA